MQLNIPSLQALHGAQLVRIPLMPSGYEANTSSLLHVPKFPNDMRNILSNEGSIKDTSSVLGQVGAHHAGSLNCIVCNSIGI